MVRPSPLHRASPLLAPALALACASAGPPAAPPPLPEALREPRVAFSRLDLDAVVALAPEVGQVSEVALLPDGALSVVGTRAALRIHGPGKVERTRFPADGKAEAWDVIRTDLDGDGADEWVNRGGNWHPAWVRDASGRTRWASGWGANALRVADLDGDGRADLVLALHGAGGLRRFDAGGREIWAVPGKNLWHVELAELDAASPGLEILHTQANGMLVVRSADGRELRRIRPPVPTTDFALLPGADAIWIASDCSLHRMPRGGGEALTVPLPLTTCRGELHAARVRLAGRSYEAVLLDYRAADRSVLALVGAEGKLEHLQVLEQSCGFLASWRARDDEALVLGCTGEVLALATPVDVWSVTVRIGERALGADAPSVLEDRIALAGAMREAGRIGDAEAQLTTVELIADPLPALHWLRLSLANAWALLLEAKGQLERADAKLAEARRLLEAVPDAHPDLRSDVHHNLGHAAQRAGDWRDAEAQYRSSLALLDPARRAGAATATTAYGLAQVLLEQGRLEEALAFAELAIEADSRSFGPEHPEVELDRALRARIEAARRDAPAHRAENLR